MDNTFLEVRRMLFLNPRYLIVGPYTYPITSALYFHGISPLLSHMMSSDWQACYYHRITK